MKTTKTIVIISGKGGTGKTSLTASFALLAKEAVLADCDVDAADLHLILSPEIQDDEEFISGEMASIDHFACTSCGKCIEACAFAAIDPSYNIDPVSCEGCAVCTLACPEDAITMHPTKCGRWFVSNTPIGPIVHAKLYPGKENSGKLVSLVRNKAKDIATQYQSQFIIVDGPSGIGCPVIASISGTDLAVIVTEPTLSGLHDLRRVIELARNFRIMTTVIINKYDINERISDEIEKFCSETGIRVIGKIPYSIDFIKSQLVGKSVIEYGSDIVSDKLHHIWNNIKQSLKIDLKEENMKIAVPLSEGRLAMHFGHCEQFVLIDINKENNQILKSETIDSPPHQPGMLPPMVGRKGRDRHHRRRHGTTGPRTVCRAGHPSCDGSPCRNSGAIGL